MFAGWKIAAIAGLSTILVGGYAWLERSWRQTAELQVQHEQEANRRNQEAIKTLRDSKEIAEKISKELQEQLAAIANKEETDTSATTDLENSDEAVKKFLDTPVPDTLRCLWGEREKCRNENGDPNPH